MRLGRLLMILRTCYLRAQLLSLQLECIPARVRSSRARFPDAFQRLAARSPDAFPWSSAKKPRCVFRLRAPPRARAQTRSRTPAGREAKDAATRRPIRRLKEEAASLFAWHLPGVRGPAPAPPYLAPSSASSSSASSASSASISAAASRLKVAPGCVRVWTSFSMRMLTCV